MAFIAEKSAVEWRLLRRNKQGRNGFQEESQWDFCVGNENTDCALDCKNVAPGKDQSRRTGQCRMGSQRSNQKGLKIPSHAAAVPATMHSVSTNGAGSSLRFERAGATPMKSQRATFTIQ